MPFQYQPRKQVIKPSQQPKILFALLLTVLAATGCRTSNVSADSQAGSVNSRSQQAGENRASLQVVTSFLPMYWFTKAVAGDKAEVKILIPPGTEVHEYQAKPADVSAIATADVLVKNGLGLEEFLAATIKNANNSKLKEITATQGIQPLGGISQVIQPKQTTAEHDHKHETGNPHVWLDPVLAKKQVENIRDGLIAADPNNKATYQANAAAYIKKLTELDRQFEEVLESHRGCTYITFHDAYPYLARRYQLKQIAMVRIPEDNLLPADIEKTVKAVKQFKVKTLLGEPGVDNKLLKILSQDLKLTLHYLNSMESGSLDPNYYFKAMKENLQIIHTACM